ncbi:MAG: FAD-dependent oxidoreductase [Candidatus Eisenbacteria bacterium]
MVGAGVAGITAARGIRELDPDVRIEIYTREPYLYYYRPRLPDLVAGEVNPADIIAHDRDWYSERKIDVRVSEPVTSVDVDARAITLEGGRRVGYGTLLLASGADPFVPPIEGADLAGVFVLRTIDDALAIRDRATGSRRAVVIGGGLLGLETARGLELAGLGVTVLEGADWLLPRQLDERAGQILSEDVKRMGIDVRASAKVSRIEGSGGATGVSLDDGTVYPGELVLISTGIRSAVGFVEDSGIEIGRGIVVDPEMRTSAPSVFAAGDVAELPGMPGGNIPVATAQAEAAARCIAGVASAGGPTAVSYNTLKIAGIDVFSVGETSCSDPSCSEHVHEDREAGIYRKVVVKDGAIAGAMVVGSGTGVTQLNDLVQKRTDVSRWGDAVAREDFDFDGLS